MKKDEIKQKRPFAPGIQWQLMLFIGGITLFTLLLVWGIITYALEPQYNRNIRAKLDSKAAAITALIDQSDAEISSRTYQGLYLNDEFWSGVSQTFRDKIFIHRLHLPFCNRLYLTPLYYPQKEKGYYR